MQRLFKEYDLEITAESKQKLVNYLDVTLNLQDGTFRPYHKPNDQIQYIHKESNHPPNIIKRIPVSIGTRLSNLSSTEIIFKESTTHYENNLRQSGYNKKLTYKPTDTNHQKRSKHKRKIIWFNPPFSKSVSTKVGKSFLSLLDIIKHIPVSIGTRLSNLSSTEIIFKESTTHYENNLRQSGYNKKLTYKPTDTNHQKHSKHKRKIIWFNPPFSKSVSTKVGKSFLSLLDLHFPRNHIYSSIFNRNKIKVSYSCMQNIKSVINNHIMKVLSNTAEIDESCNCRNKNNCPLDGKGLTPNIIYEAQITSN